MKALNRKHRGRDRYTDVMAFAMKDGRRLKGEGDFLGDIIISLDAAARQAGYFKSTKERELKLYLIHGMLHLLGYDDETKGGFNRMSKRQIELIESV